MELHHGKEQLTEQQQMHGSQPQKQRLPSQEQQEQHATAEGQGQEQHATAEKQPPHATIKGQEQQHTTAEKQQQYGTVKEQEQQHAAAEKGQQHATAEGQQLPFLRAQLEPSQQTHLQLQQQPQEQKDNQQQEKPDTLKLQHPTCQPQIPKIIHQTAKDRQALPPLWALSQASWKANHPTWEYRMWSDEQNLNLCKEHFPWFLDTYNSLPKNIMRVDAVRYMYMYAHGGVYSDLDSENLKPLDGLLEGRAAVLAVMGTDMGFKDSIPNAFLASVPGHPFWLHLLRAIKEVAGQDITETQVEAVAGE